MEINNEIIIDFMSNPAVRNIPGFNSFQSEVVNLLGTRSFKLKSIFTETECSDIRKAIEYVKECNESWAENGDIQMAASHDLIISAVRKAIRKGRKC